MSLLSTSRRMLRYPGAAVGVVTVALGVVALVPVRAVVPPATVALVLVVPVVASVAIGGAVAGVAAVAAGFIAYDVFFIPPYGTLAVGRGVNWIPLGIYVVVGAIAITLDERFRRSRDRALRQARILGALADLPERLLGAQNAAGLVGAAVEALARVNGPGGAALVRADGAGELIWSGSNAEHAARVQRAFSSDATGRGSIVLRERGFEARGSIVSTLGGPEGTLVVWGPRLDEATVGALEVVAHQLSAALERDRLRQAEVRLATLEQVDGWRLSLLRTVSHDLLTPLASIETAVSTVAAFGAAIAPSDHDELLETALAQCRRASTLVEDLLDVSRLEAGVRRVRRVVCELGEVVHDAVRAVEVRGFGSEVCVLADGPVKVLGDASLLREVVWNLVDNAVRHGPLGDVVEVRVLEQSGDALIEVVDHAPMSGDVDPRGLFDWFHASGVSGRTGLGLAIARSFVEAHGGRVEFESEPDATSVRVVLPRLV
ncbi:histidine kinase [Acidimicrobium ferrooxidans DSM 10331]|uniref:histidine kinase n=1 Tax=Acidimicrobium ferrooxidans (strain DSM 10331 / JCM 15462 / NBRC 103882 / ICP) TaxID=525909 RepID=C7LZE8_ACIFD|nr:DUF4118 domain-containing protein [Acidimicrobium ferrooxidans]ACU54106.1 histidine kinase [Acidimicrobium ferrooxidans DSM 10331]